MEHNDILPDWIEAETIRKASNSIANMKQGSRTQGLLAGRRTVSLRDKERCFRCTHPRYEHTGNHIQGHRTICRADLGRGLKCVCLAFKKKGR